MKRRNKKLVEKVTNRVKRRLWEDAEQDRLFREQALDVYKKLVDYLKSGGELKDFGRAVTIDQFTELEQEAKFPLKIKWEQEDESSATASYVGEKRQPIIRLYVLDKDIYDSQKEARRAMRRQLENHAKIFMHEYIHYLDDRRTDVDLGQVIQYDREGGKQMSVYFSDPVEVNAYFQSGLTQLEHTLEVPGLLSTRMEDDWNGNFRDFKDWFFDEHIPPQMQYNISDDQEKRLINRLYGFWQQIKKEYG